MTISKTIRTYNNTYNNNTASILKNTYIYTYTSKNKTTNKLKSRIVAVATRKSYKIKNTYAATYI